jgi:hypothetical protein
LHSIRRGSRPVPRVGFREQAAGLNPGRADNHQGNDGKCESETGAASRRERCICRKRFTGIHLAQNRAVRCVLRLCRSVSDVTQRW